MSTYKTFRVFGEEIEILIDGNTSKGTVTVLTQTSPPGGGPPLHSHTYEDETFTVLQGEFELFDGTSWQPLPKGQAFFAPRGGVHSFRNSGTTEGKMLIYASPAGMDDYLEQISPLSVPNDLEELKKISQRFGIQFVE